MSRYMREESIRCVCGWTGHGYGNDPCPRCGSRERSTGDADVDDADLASRLAERDELIAAQIADACMIVPRLPVDPEMDRAATAALNRAREKLGQSRKIYSPAQIESLAAERDRLRAEVDRMRELLEWLDRGGGLGSDVHELIRKTLATLPRTET